MGNQENGREAWLALKNNYQNTSRQRSRRTQLRRVGNSVMSSDIDPDVFLLDDLGETVSDERLTTIILDALPEKMYFIVNMQSVRDPDSGLEEEIISKVKMIFINHSERSSVSKTGKESYRKVRSSGIEPRTDNVRESAMTLACHHCKKLGHKKKDCDDLMGKSDKPSSVENGTRKWCSYHHSNGHSNENCYQQQQPGERWCTYHKSGTHSDDQCYIITRNMVAVTLPLEVKVQKMSRLLRTVT